MTPEEAKYDDHRHRHEERLAEHHVDRYTIAPGVVCETNGGYWHLFGLEADLIAAGLCESDWFAVRPKRDHYYCAGGQRAFTERLAKGVMFVNVVPIKSYDPDPPADDHNGNRKVAWSDCAWRPTTSAVIRALAPRPESVKKLKSVLQSFADGKDDPISTFGAAALAYIKHLEARAVGKAPQ